MCQALGASVAGEANPFVAISVSPAERRPDMNELPTFKRAGLGRMGHLGPDVCSVGGRIPRQPADDRQYHRQGRTVRPPAPPTRPMTARPRASKSGMRAPCRSFPAAPLPSGKRDGHLPTAPLDRKLLLSHQGLAATRHPLRQTRPQFPRHHLLRPGPYWAML
jgi:hypothetical protein